MKTPNLGILGALPLYSTPLPVGQLYFPSKERYRRITTDIFSREYYTNQGPLTQKLEANLEKFLNVRNVICVSNATIGLIMAAEALELKGSVIVPSFTFIASPQSLSYCGITPVFCDVDKNTHHITAETLDKAYSEKVTGVLGVNLWGQTADVCSIDSWAKDRGIVSYWDSAQAVGSCHNRTAVGGNGKLEVFSMHTTKILSAAEGGFITTNCDEMAEKLRNIRSSYGTRKKVEVTKTANGRMSEFQAAIGLLNLEDFEKNRANNENLLSSYETALEDIPGISLTTRPSQLSNCQYAVLEVDQSKFGLTRDQLLASLHAENIIARRYFYPGCHKQIPYINQRQPELENTDFLSERIIQLPLGARTSDNDVARIAERISDLRKNRSAIEKATK